MNANERLLAALIQIRDQGPLDRGNGICRNIHYLLGEVEAPAALRVMRELSREWPLFSGDPEYPVPCPDLDPFEAYVSPYKKWSGPYGEARLDLLQFLIENLS